MNVKRVRNALLIAGIPLFIASCGGDASKEKAGDGTTPATLPDTLKVRKLSKTYVITGIGLSGSNKVAIINNQVVTPGMEIGSGVVLKDVQPTYATILHGNTEYLLRPENIQNELDKKKH